ncbi:MAG: hypothetical protein QI223_04900 [Candidatus Korarchaeota archaeon]|nr:hypothetical protein [Candidatus Korarchaeota archaeon]
MSALRAAGALTICLALGGFLALVAANKAGASHLSPVDARVGCYASGDKVVVIASSEEVEVGEVEGIRMLVGASVPQVFVALPQPTNYTTPPPTAQAGLMPPPPPTVGPRYVDGEVVLVDAREGRALGLPWAVLSDDPVRLAQRVEELAAASSQLESPRWAPGDYLKGEVAVPSPGKWYAVVVAVAEADSPIPANATVDCGVFLDLEAKVYPGLNQALRSAYLAVAGILLILLDRVRSGREEWSTRA